MNLSTVRDYIRYATSVFNRSNLYYGHGTNNAIDEAIQLVLGTLDLPLAIPQEFYAASVTPEEKEQLFHNINMRVESRTPTAYIINRSWFCGHEFYVDERVLIPRSPIAELINNRFEGILSVEPTNILDLCTGSGCIGIACAYEYPYAEVDLVDISPDALAIAEINIQSHQLNHRVFPICSDLFTDLPDIQYDLIVSNPPYVDEEDMGDLPEEYLTEPELALASGADGLDITKKILNQASNYLSDSGVLVCEVGNSWVALQDTYPDVPFHWIKFQHGGSGVFWLSKQELQTYQSNFE